jgi:hypothetical protein
MPAGTAPTKEMPRKTAEEFETECLRLVEIDTPDMVIDLNGLSRGGSGDFKLV